MRACRATEGVRVKATDGAKATVDDFGRTSGGARAHGTSDVSAASDAPAAPAASDVPAASAAADAPAASDAAGAADAEAPGAAEIDFSTAGLAGVGSST